MNTKRIIIITLTCIILGLTPAPPVLGGTQGGEGAPPRYPQSPQRLQQQAKDKAFVYEAPPQRDPYAQRNALSLLSQADNYLVTLRFIGCDGSPATYTDVHVIETSLSFNPTYLYSQDTGEIGELSLNLPRGTYLLMIHRMYYAPKFLAYCYLSVTGDSVIDVDVRPFVLPVTMEAIKPIVGRGFSTGCKFIVRDSYTGWSWEFFGTLGPGKMLVYLPINAKFDALYMDWGSSYLLYKSSVQARGLNTKVQFDGSKTGFIQANYVLPSNPPSASCDSYLVLSFNGLQGYGYDDWAISTGSYPAEAYVSYYNTDGDIAQYLDYWFDMGKVTIAAKKTTTMSYGGDMVMTAKAKKATYKPGELLQVEYLVKDQFKHTLIDAYKWDYNTTTHDWNQTPWIMTASISDAGGVLSEYTWETWYVGGSELYQLWIDNLATSGSYTLTVTWDTEVYQGPLSASTPLMIKSTSKIPELDYNHLSGQTIDIGVIAPDTLSYQTLEPYITQIIQPDLNTLYADQNIDFQFQVVDAQGNAQTHLDLVTAFHESGVDLVIGGGWSSQAAASLNYVNINNMILVSYSSTSPTIAIAGDRLFRFCPSDSSTAPSLIDMLWSKGIKSVVIIQRGDSWGDGIVNLFKPAWTAKGGKLAGEAVRYDTEASDFTDYLQVAEDQATAALVNYPGKVAVLLLSFNEASIIATQAEGYTHIYNVKWYGADGTAALQSIIDDAGSQAVHLGLYSLLAQTPDSPEYQALGDRYTALTGQSFGTYMAYVYDVAFALAGTVASTESVDAGVVAVALPGFCKTYEGVSGNCALNIYGDRVPGLYDIWSYGYVSGSSGPVEAIEVGTVNPMTRRVTWDLP